MYLISINILELRGIFSRAKLLPGVRGTIHEYLSDYECGISWPVTHTNYLVTK